MIAKRIIACLDVDRGRVVKGVKFKNLGDVGDPLAVAIEYNKQNVDEVTFLDITASSDSRPITIELVKDVAKNVFIPFCVGGGIKTLVDIKQLLEAGADKVSINTAAVTNPSLVKEAAQIFGSQCIVVSIDAKKVAERKWNLFIKGGRVDTGIDAVEFSRKMEADGAGEILLNSIDKDGTRLGFDIELTNAITNVVNIPVIASGGAKDAQSFVDVFTKTNCDAALGASIFHYGECTVFDVKKEIQKKGMVVRI
jgi:imidazole glycerol-phosphate synthase subunit HisF